MGGEGSGRKPDVVKRMIEQRAPIGMSPAHDGLFLPNLSGVQDAALKTSPDLTVGGGENFWTSGSSALWPIDTTKGISGSSLEISGSSLVVNATTGRVGIGTTNPSYLFDVIGNARVYSTLYIFGSAYYFNAGTIRNGNLFITGAAPTNNIYTYNNLSMYTIGTNTDISFGTNSIIRMVINNSGKVGIGTTIPATTLEVNGAISGSSITVGTDPVLLSSMSGSWNSDDWLVVSGSYQTTANNNWLSVSSSYLTAETDPVFLALSGSLGGGEPVFLAVSGGYNTDLASGSSYYKNLVSGSAHYIDSSDPHGATLTQTYLNATSISGSTIKVLGDEDATSGSFVRNIVLSTTSGGMTVSSFTQGTVLLVYA